MESFAIADLVDRPLVELFSPGERLLVRLGREQAFEGALERAGRDHVELSDVRELGNPRPLTRTYTLYRNEIDRIERTRRPRGEAVNGNDDCDGTVVKMDEGEYRRLEEVSRRYVYVESYEGQNDAIEGLLEYESLGVVALGLMPDARLDGVGLLVIAGWDRVYVCDMLRLVDVRGALKSVLECRRVRKILHRAGPTVDILRRRYNTTIHNVFDTETADLIIRKRTETESRDLSQCLVGYFNFPPSTLREALRTRAEKWRRARPLSERRLLYASQLAVYLIPLRDEMRRAMFGEVTATSERICDHVYDMSSYHFNQQLGESGDVDDELDRLVPELSLG